MIKTSDAESQYRYRQVSRGLIPPPPSHHWKTQKVSQTLVFTLFDMIISDGRDGPMDRWTPKDCVSATENHHLGTREHRDVRLFQKWERQRARLSSSDTIKIGLNTAEGKDQQTLPTPKRNKANKERPVNRQTDAVQPTAIISSVVRVHKWTHQKVFSDRARN